MKRSQFLIAGVILAIVLIGGIIFVQNLQSTSSNNQKNQIGEIMMKDKIDDMEEESVMEKNEDSMQKEDVMKENSGQYIPYSKDSLTSNKNVIFFAASWCPTCRGLDNAINSELGNIPSDLTILKADYDAETSLKQKYGVTYQHTLVQVDKDGNMLKKWNGSENVLAILNELK